MGIDIDSELGNGNKHWTGNWGMGIEQDYEWNWTHHLPYVIVIGVVVGDQFPSLEQRGREGGIDVGQLVRRVAAIFIAEVDQRRERDRYTFRSESNLALIKDYTTSTIYVHSPLLRPCFGHVTFMCKSSQFNTYHLLAFNSTINNKSRTLSIKIPGNEDTIVEV